MTCCNTAVLTVRALVRFIVSMSVDMAGYTMLVISTVVTEGTVELLNPLGLMY